MSAGSPARPAFRLDDNERAPPPMLTPYRVRGLTLKNRVIVSPMAMYSATDGLIDDFHLTHWARRALGGAGLGLAEMTCVSPDARITPGCLGLWSDEQEAQWKRLVDLIHGAGAKAGNSTGPCRPQGLDQSRLGRHRPAARNGRVGADFASALAYLPNGQNPASHESRRHRPGARRFCRGYTARGGGWL